MDEKTILRIDSLLKHVDQVLADTNGITVDDLKKSNILIRATCFSIAQIGEMMNQLEKTLSEKYYNLPWLPARRMRNIIFMIMVGPMLNKFIPQFTKTFYHLNLHS